MTPARNMPRDLKRLGDPGAMPAGPAHRSSRPRVGTEEAGGGISEKISSSIMTAGGPFRFRGGSIHVLVLLC
jgi:hypothetical protein